MSSPDAQAGRDVRCDRCGMVQKVPAGEGLSVTLAASEPTSPGPDQPRVKATHRVRSAGVIDCGDCGRAMPATEMSCPDCGWVNAELVKRKPLSDELDDSPRSLGLSAYTSTVFIGLTNMRTTLLMILAALIALVLLGAIQAHVSIALSAPIAALRGIFTIAYVVEILVLLLVAGWILHFHLQNITMALLGETHLPDAENPGLRSFCGTGVQALVLVLVFVMPVITLPLLPLVLLALSQADDEQAIDVRWALRAAIRHADALAVTWAAISLYIAAATALVWLSWPVVVDASSGYVCRWVGVIALPPALHTLACGASRCIGLMGLARPTILKSLPQGNLRSLTITIFGAILLMYLLWGVAVRALLS